MLRLHAPPTCATRHTPPRAAPGASCGPERPGDAARDRRGYEGVGRLRPAPTPHGLQARLGGSPLQCCLHRAAPSQQWARVTLHVLPPAGMPRCGRCSLAAALALAFLGATALPVRAVDWCFPRRTDIAQPCPDATQCCAIWVSADKRAARQARAHGGSEPGGQQPPNARSSGCCCHCRACAARASTTASRGTAQAAPAWANRRCLPMSRRRRRVALSTHSSCPLMGPG